LLFVLGRGGRREHEEFRLANGDTGILFLTNSPDPEVLLGNMESLQEVLIWTFSRSQGLRIIYTDLLMIRV
jgi:hypothetical protein